MRTEDVVNDNYGTRKEDESMTLEEIECRLTELRREQLQTVAKWKKDVIRGEIQNMNTRKARLLETHKLRVSGS